MHVTGPVLDDPGTIQANHSVSLAYYLSLVIAVLLAILSIIGAVAMLRLFLFHIRLGKSNTCHIWRVHGTEGLMIRMCNN